MKHQGPSDNWLDQARQLLDDEVQAQDYALRARLTAVRQQVLQQHAPLRTRMRGVLQWAAVAAGVSSLALVAQLTWLDPSTALVPAASVEQAALLVTDEALLVAADNLELYENLEFYAWLQSQPVDG